MVKKTVWISLLLIIVMTSAVWAANDNQVGLKVKIIDSQKRSLTADSIILLERNRDKIVEYRKKTDEVKFSNLKRKEYRVAVGKEGYQLEMMKVQIEQDKQLEIELQEGNKVKNEIIVFDQFNHPLNNVQVELFKGKTRQNKDITKNGKTSFKIWPGVVYRYKFSKKEYTDYEEKNIYLGKESLHQDINLLRRQKRILSKNEDKIINLGRLSPNEIAVIAISPFDFVSGHANYNNTTPKIYNPTLSVEYSGKKSTSPEEEEQNHSKNKVQQKDNSKKESENKLLFRVSKTKKGRLTNNFSNQKPTDEYKIKKREKFYVKDLYKGEYHKITAELREKRKNVLIFVDNNVTVDASDIKLLADKFNNEIFTTNMGLFASHKYTHKSLYDTDKNGSPIILITSFGKKTFGFFDSSDYYSGKYSNSADMLYINSDALNNSSITIEEILGGLTHEFQHLIYFIEKNINWNEEGEPEEVINKWLRDRWVDEGIAMLASYLNGYYNYNTDREEKYLSAPSKESLLYWEQKKNDYGSSGLFVFYLYEQYGINIIKELVTNCEEPIEIISKYSGQDFSNIYLTWILSLLANDKLGEKYHYPIDTTEKINAEVINTTVSKSFNIADNGVKYYKIKGNDKEVKIKINGLKKRTGIVVYKKQF